MNGPMAAYAGRSKRGLAVTASDRLVHFARELNELRAPDHRERISQAVAVTREYFRPRPDSALPAAGADALLDAVRELETACEGSRSGYEEACANLERLERLESQSVRQN
jgi:hypothetical protein